MEDNAAQKDPTEEVKFGMFLSLPFELEMQVLLHLSDKELVNAAQACKVF